MKFLHYFGLLALVFVANNQAGYVSVPVASRVATTTGTTVAPTTSATPMLRSWFPSH